MIKKNFFGFTAKALRHDEIITQYAHLLIKTNGIPSTVLPVSRYGLFTSLVLPGLPNTS